MNQNRGFANCLNRTIYLSGTLDATPPSDAAHEMQHIVQCVDPLSNSTGLGLEQLLYMAGANVYNYSKFGPLFWEGRAQAAGDCLAENSASACRITPTFQGP